MNDKTSNDLYGKIKHCNEFINHSNDSNLSSSCLLYTSDAADELDGVDLGGRRIIKKK
ncbi:hypothetical protein JMUB7530_28070 [Staphylococcus aureus]